MILINEGFWPENTPNKLTKEEFIKLFNDTQHTKKEKDEAYSAWMEQKQIEMDESNNPNSRLIYNVEVAELLVEIGFSDDALDYINAAWHILSNEYNDFNNAPQEIQGLIVRLQETASKIVRE